MRNFIEIHPKLSKLLAALILIFLLSAAFLIFQYKPYTLVVDGQWMRVKTIAFSPQQLLRQVGYAISENDLLKPELQFTLNLPETITLTRARPITIVFPDKTQTITTPELLPDNILRMAGLDPIPEDQITLNGQALDPFQPLPPGQPLILQFQPAKVIRLTMDGIQSLIYTQANTLGEALYQAEIDIQPEDNLSQSLDYLLQPENEVSLEKAKLVRVVRGDLMIEGLSSAKTIAEALKDLNIPLQNLDFTLPSEDAPLPEERTIELYQVSETISLQKQETAFSNSYQLDPEAELDTVSVITPGQLGLDITRSRSKIINDVETDVLTEGPWKASDPVDGVLGYGTKIVIRTEVVDGQTIEYWRKKTVYVTSYHPAEFDGSTLTKSGLPLTKGIVAVATSWYSGLEFQPVYVPGYGQGIIADTGYGIPGTPWIDLGYDDENYVGWHYWTTIYFLTPVPAYVQAVLP